ncbi:hypothetical protein OG554_03420 [Streptomyces griseus]|uniref:hypothetical protein n=1 Tax=Streptomyces griseus TaxID=1911 RepID=UPI0038703E5A|nr:hypothetical protein OG554_03420 [Streptomyces fimicarius]
MTDTITAAELIRNDRVILDPSELPHLVDLVRGDGPTVYVVFSSGEERVFSNEATVTIVD